MELKIKPAKKNHFPLGGFLIKSPSAKQWILELQSLSLGLREIRVFAIPDTTAKSVWGCLVIPDQKIDAQTVGKNELCQAVFSNFFIPEKSSVSPYISKEDRRSLFSEAIHILHPEFGMVEFEEEFDFEALLREPEERSPSILQPHDASFIPQRIRSFQIKAVDPEDALKDLEDKAFPKREKLPDEPLDLFEKGKLTFYKTLFDKSKGKDTERTDFMDGLDSLMKSFSGQDNKWADDLQDDFENLEERNRKKLEKFLDMMKNDPENALRYAVPLDPSGTGRGDEQMRLEFGEMWGDFSLFGADTFGGAGSGGGSFQSNSYFDQLNAQYNKTAEELIKQKKYEKAAFVYLKLLKNPYQAAQTLEDGKLYQEAAAIYLKHLKNKTKAAECYEKGNMTRKAIEIYEELEEFEKVGDLYMKLQKRGLAVKFYEQQADIFKKNRQYILASELYQNKINDRLKTQATLLEGWNKDAKAHDCLKRYFNNIPDINELKKEFNFIYSKKVTNSNRRIFLKIVLNEYKKKTKIAEHLKQIGYEIIAKEAVSNPDVIGELKRFNTKDQNILADILRFRKK